MLPALEFTAHLHEQQQQYETENDDDSIPLPPPPPPPPTTAPLQQIVTWHCVWSEEHARYYFCNFESKATTWDKPEGKNCRLVLARTRKHSTASNDDSTGK